MTTDRLNVRRRGWVATMGVTVGLLGCAGGGGSPPRDGGAGGATGSGGSLATGGSAAGGAATSTGGGPAAATGGGPATGGAAPATGGATAGGGGGLGTGGVGATGGTASATGGTAAGGAATGGAAGRGAGGAAGAGLSSAGVTKDAEVRLTSAGLTVVSYGGYLNGESFQQEGILSHAGYQYTAFWNTARHVVLARRALPTAASPTAGAWSAIEFTDYTNTESDAHNTISLGICPGDGTLHLSFDHHGSVLHYRKSVVNLVTAPATGTWAASSFGAVQNALVGTTAVNMVTYPRFITQPGGAKMLMELRLGSSGSGDEHLWEYDAATHAWTALGKFIDGMTDNVNGYPHGLSYTPGGTRLHVSWCWRETPDATTNHDLLYAYSDDHGRTWKNNAGTTVATSGSSYLRPGTSGLRVVTIGQNRGLINQEHMAVDASGRVHVLLSHLPDAQADDSNFDSARRKGQWFHYWRNGSGTWTRTSIGVGTIAAFRGKLAIASTGNLYAVLPDLRIAGASAASSFATWSTLNSTDAGRFFSDPLIDATRLLTEDKLSVVYGEKSSPNIYVLDYTLK